MVNGRLWTKHEDDYLRECYRLPGNSVKSIATFLGRTEYAVTSRVAYLHLTKTAYFMTNILTPREIDVCNLLIQDLTYSQIAQELGVAKSTIVTHAKSIYAKNYVNSRKQLKEKYNESRTNS